MQISLLFHWTYDDETICMRLLPNIVLSQRLGVGIEVMFEWFVFQLALRVEWGNYMDNDDDNNDMTEGGVYDCQ